MLPHVRRFIRFVRGAMKKRKEGRRGKAAKVRKESENLIDFGEEATMSSPPEPEATTDFQELKSIFTIPINTPIINSTNPFLQ